MARAVELKPLDPIQHFLGRNKNTCIQLGMHVCSSRYLS